MEVAHYIGVDVGTSSVRAAVVKQDGKIIAKASETIRIWNPDTNFYLQSSDDIWNAVTQVVKTVVDQSGVDKDFIHGIGFDATCSLVILDDEGKPVSVCPNDAKGSERMHTFNEQECDIIMWMDHRAEEEAKFINSTKHDALKCVGGQMSLEMQPPKLLWLKRNLPDSWTKACHFFDLPDFLTWKATQSTSRSLCSLVCKWSYHADNQGNQEWNQNFYKTIGLEDLLENDAAKIGTSVQSPGTPCGNGLCDSAAWAMGLKTGTPVGTSIVDAHSGVLGCVGCVPEGGPQVFPLPDIMSRMVLICGTSVCHMIIDELIESHPAYSEAQKKANHLHKGKPGHIHECLNQWLNTYAQQEELPFVSHLARDYHIYPDFYGNRSPLADPTMKGMKCGMTLSVNLRDLAIQYLATVQALAYGTRHIIDEMKKAGHAVEVIYMCGGLSKNPLYVETHADVLGLPVILPCEEESVLVGSAVLGACASKDFGSIQDAMLSMCGEGKIISPSKSQAGFHDKKYRVFRKMVEDQYQYQEIMRID
ncbi:FGGY carbohydrate kinase domain-containing protein-like isoform X2 [Ostrea edulis]|uniref:FGGY carbohydrate kinase domain-containing protein-like isoform X2 n=1 Tax=Ostrea edulis TaxID=37623 RepID=UPI0024AE9D44|nr:FGGY carbohydrate kinase domain-containing protein-like isoform X2 [Ostrea edulis]